MWLALKREEEPRNVGGSYKLEKASDMFSARVSRKECSLPTPRCEPNEA